ncbi:hypothetical protein HY486_01360 [Candidatus Woesearchaeota archaeon]|nr:hypothetical protein [Candidatus Woesearchaeota archaeon]
MRGQLIILLLLATGVVAERGIEIERTAFLSQPNEDTMAVLVQVKDGKDTRIRVSIPEEGIFAPEKLMSKGKAISMLDVAGIRGEYVISISIKDKDKRRRIFRIVDKPYQ